jgi:terminase large subunit-like protein
VATAERLRRDIEALKAFASPQRAIPSGAVELARIGGMEELDPWQENALRSEAPRILFNVSRQGGKSSVSGLLSADTALRVPGSLTLVLAPSERQAKETFAKAAHFYLATGQIVPPDSYRKLGMELTNGSRIEALPGTEKTIRGFSGVDLLIVEEAARVADELYYAVRPMLAVSGGRLVMLSTPYGKRGVFYEEWTNGRGWERYEVPATEIPRIPASFLEEEREALPSWVYRQEYECSFEETEDQVFTTEMVERAVTREVAPLFGG